MCLAQFEPANGFRIFAVPLPDIIKLAYKPVLCLRLKAYAEAFAMMRATFGRLSQSIVDNMKRV